MMIKKMVRECDMTNTKYETRVEGAALIARGATGRWCEVIWAGPEWIAANNPEVLEYEAAVAVIRAHHPNDTIDF